jgi:hypothetical protein
MWLLALIPFSLQALAILIDEGYFHYRRGLPKWERIGHPLDTFSLLICLGIILFLPFNLTNLKIYGFFSVVSCLMVTKDEFVHIHECTGAENWLHALLFILHPITLVVAGMIWARIQGVDIPAWMYQWLDHPIALQTCLYTFTALISSFLLYQIIFWNFIWKKRLEAKN